MTYYIPDFCNVPNCANPHFIFLYFFLTQKMADVVENEAKMAYMKPSGTAAANAEEPRGPSKGFVVREAPWATSSEKVNLRAFYMASVVPFWSTVLVGLRIC